MQQSRLPNVCLDAQSQGPDVPRLNRATRRHQGEETELQGLPRCFLHPSNGAQRRDRLHHVFRKPGGVSVCQTDNTSCMSGLPACVLSAMMRSFTTF